MGLQQLTVIEIVGVLHVAGGVMLRNVQCLKAVVIRYDLAVVFNRKAHGSENFFQLALHERDGVIGAAVGIHRQRDIILLCAVDKAVFLLLPDALHVCCDAFVDFALERIDGLAEFFFLRAGKVFKAL